MKTKPFLLLTFLTIIPACSVLEERSDCPCILEVNTNRPTEGRILDVAGFESGERVLFDRFETKSCPYRYEREIKRCLVSIAGVLSSREVTYSDNDRTVYIDKGKEADSLFAGVAPVDATGETATSTVCLHKQFTTIRIYDESEREDSDLYRLEVSGCYAGLDVLTLCPVTGNYFYQTDFREKSATFRIPRMDGDGSLKISFVTAATGEAFRDFPIGKLMVDAGYNCHAEDLQDVEIAVNLINFKCSVTVRNWNGEVIVVDI